MPSPVSIAFSAAKNFKVDQSIWAGGGASVLTVAVGAILVAAGVAIPPIAILGIHAAIPLTMEMFTAVAIPIGHFVTACVSPTKNQSIDALAKKIGVGFGHLKSFIPEIQATYPVDKDAPLAEGMPNENINRIQS